MEKIKKIIEFFKIRYRKYPQIYWVFGLIIIWFISIPVIRFVDPTGGVFDAGIFQIPIFTIILNAIFLLIAWLIVQTIFAHLYRYAKEEIKQDFKELTKWQKVRVYYFVFFSLVFALVLLARVLVVTPIR